MISTWASPSGAGQFVGTPAYAAPQHLPAGSIDERSDLYAPGLVAYEMLCGKLPCPLDNSVELVRRRLNVDVTRLAADAAAVPPSPSLCDLHLHELDRPAVVAGDREPRRLRLPPAAAVIVTPMVGTRSFTCCLPILTVMARGGQSREKPLMAAVRSESASRSWTAPPQNRRLYPACAQLRVGPARPLVTRLPRRPPLGAP